LQEEDCTRSVLDFVHELLAAPSDDLPSLESQLGRLARSFQANRSGFVGLIGTVPAVQFAGDAYGEVFAGLDWPGERWNELTAQAAGAAARAVTLPLEDRKYLFTAGSEDGYSWLFWLEDGPERSWSTGEQGAFALAALTLLRAVIEQGDANNWNRWRDRARRQQGLDNAARVVSRLVHDFNNVLTGILGFTELSLGQVSPGSPPYQFIREAHQAAQQGTQLVNQLSVFTKRSAPRFHPISLASVVQEERNRFQQSWPPGINLVVDTPAKLFPVALEPEALRFILCQLGENAREAVGTAGTIAIKAHEVELTDVDCLDILGKANVGLHIRLTVADTGPGFTPEAREQVLSGSFFSTKPRHYGLGLPAVYATLCAYRGGLRLEHDQGNGTAVHVYLPVAQREKSTLAIRRSKLPLAQGEKLLVVDDEPKTLELMCVTLERAGYRVDRAGDAAEALSSFTSTAEPFRLVVTDVVMPRMTGFELAKRLQEQDPKVQVLFTSGHVAAGFIPADLAGRDFDLLPKPFRPEGLLRAVRAALDRELPLAGPLQDRLEPEKKP
jgi:signal transduction histidine kinase/ActR/RegA family two-component response regulator